ncbi:pupal cuticle protein Edg-84A [Scaptodrosophila lebanonensis]|uniref:Pupal cuticle protein Edg-84A n=1 Tax=Drosophila lebanonensis TaxID=7225 RepID=A0A6J2TGZ9_DROLE|nr:pupal cuticle protein Edg-84A [Scaptodrosophila lebanonensis]
MFYKLTLLAALLAISNAALLPVKPVANEDTYDAHPRYSFGYDVQDSITGDVKSQTETRDGDTVEGQYSLNDADGYRRIVKYVVAGDRGFTATVHREPLARAPQLAAPRPAAVAVPIIAPKKQLQKLPMLKSYVQPAAYIKTYSSPAFIHQAPAAVVHASPVHLASAAHIVHAAPAAIVSHHSPALVKTLHASHPHAVSYVF